MKTFQPVMNDLDRPLVSVLIYNYNYGRYLQACLESVIEQTYSNIEIVFSDNASTDESWEIAQAFAQKYPGKMTIIRNRENMGPGANLRNCFMAMQGKFCVTLCSDDILLPEFVENCLSAFKEDPRLGYVMVHHAEIDAEGHRRDIPPFYDRSCVIDGEEQAAVYMMAAVNPSISQVMYDRLKLESVAHMTGALASRWYGARIQDFNLCLQYPMAYINKPLLLYRKHGENDSFSADDSLLEVIGPYILLRQFNEAGELRQSSKITARYDAAVAKLAALSLRYCVRHLQAENEATARRYFHLAAALSPGIIENDIYISLSEYWMGDVLVKQEILSNLRETANLVERQVSYAPPEGHKPILSLSENRPYKVVGSQR